MNVTLGAPLAEALDATEAKAFLDLTGSAYDTLLTRLRSAAREQLERHACLSLVTRTVTLKLSRSEAQSPLWLPYGPAQAITSLTVYDDDGTATVIGSGAYYLDGDYLVELPSGNGWTADLDRPYLSAQVVYTAGYGDAASDVPEGLQHAGYVLLADLFEQRQSETPGTTVARFSQSWQSLAEPFTQGHLSTWY